MIVGDARDRLYRPGEVADRLGIQPQTLRVWSTEFAAFLSASATKAPTGSGAPGQRKYTEADVRVLLRARELLDTYRSYDYARRRLREEADQPAPADAAAPPAAPGGTDTMMSAQAEELARLRSAVSEAERALADKDDELALLRGELWRWETAASHWRGKHDRASADAERFRRALKQVSAERAALAVRLRPWWVRLWRLRRSIPWTRLVWSAVVLLTVAIPAWLLLTAPRPIGLRTGPPTGTYATTAFLIVAVTAATAVFAVAQHPVFRPRWLDRAATGAALLGAAAGGAYLTGLLWQCGAALLWGGCHL
jgi:DNA-binding transcriptional MerR regulator